MNLTEKSNLYLPSCVPWSENEMHLFLDPEAPQTELCCPVQPEAELLAHIPKEVVEFRKGYLEQVPAHLKVNPQLWGECTVGALTEEER